MDNTFGTVRWTPGDPSASLGDWLEETGHGETIGWYNRKARSPEQIRSLQSVRVSPEAASRIRERVSTWLGDHRGRSD